MADDTGGCCGCVTGILILIAIFAFVGALSDDEVVVAPEGPKTEIPKVVPKPLRPEKGERASAPKADSTEAEDVGQEWISDQKRNLRRVGEDAAGVLKGENVLESSWRKTTSIARDLIEDALD